MPWDDHLGRRLKLKDIQIFMTVVAAGGISKAAKRLNYTQPTVSKALASLEHTLQRKLLERGRRGIELTPYGNALVKCGTAVFDDLRRGVVEIDCLSDPTAGEVRIGCTESVSGGILSATIGRVAQRHPNIKFDIVSQNPVAIYRELEARNVDLVVAQMMGHIEDERLHAEILYDERVVVVASAGHPFARKRRLLLAELVDEAWILPLPRSFICSTVVNAFRAQGLRAPHTTGTIATPYVRSVLVANGRFITVLPEPMLTFGIKQLGIKALPVELPQNRRPVGIVTLKNRPLSPTAQLFIEHVRAVAKLMARKK